MRSKNKLAIIMFRIFMLVILISATKLLMGCQQNPSKEMKESTETDIAKIEKALTDYALYWNKSDMDSWGTLFTDDVDYINRRGGWWKNNKENIEGHKHIHEIMAQMEQPKTFRLDIGQIEFIKPDVAVVQALSEWPGFKSYGTEGGTETLKGILSCVFVKKEGKWLIKTLHNTLREENEHHE